MSRFRVDTLGPAAVDLYAPPLPAPILAAMPSEPPAKCPCRTLARRLYWTAASAGAAMLVGIAMAVAGLVQMATHP